MGCAGAPDAVRFTGSSVSRHRFRAGSRGHTLCSRGSAPVGSAGRNPIRTAVLQVVLFPCDLLLESEPGEV